MKVLMIDVGGTSVKMMASGHEGFRKFPSGRKLTAAQMARGVRKETADWKYQAIALGFPGLVVKGKPARNPLNLGGGWVDYNYSKAFGCRVRIINDAALHALAVYESGRMLFIGLGTSIGATLVADDVIIPVEVGLLRFSKTVSFADRLCKESLKTIGVKRWEKSAWKAIALLRDIFWPDDVVIGGGNAEKLTKLPEGCRRSDNQYAFRGALRLWPGSDMLAEPRVTTWQIKRSAKRKA